MVDIKQFKLANDEEIMCEVVEWNNDTTDDIIIRRALKIVAMDDLEEGMRYYTFKPWMSFETDPDTLQAVNSYHIVGSSNPNGNSLSYYYDIIREMKDQETEEPIIKTFGDSDDSNVIQFSPTKQIH